MNQLAKSLGILAALFIMIIVMHFFGIIYHSVVWLFKGNFHYRFKVFNRFSINFLHYTLTNKTQNHETKNRLPARMAKRSQNH